MTEEKLAAYRVLTGVDDSAFCHRVSAELEKGYVLHGSPSCTFDSHQNRMLIAQAIVKRDGIY